ncbi:MAG: four helix bundle protein [Pseudomonadota bacterium]
MALAHELPIYKATFDLCKEVFTCVRNMPRDVKHTLGEKLMTECADMVVLILRANVSKHKAQHIDELRERLQVVELMFRLLSDMRCIDLRRFAAATVLTATIGKQATGWKKSTAASPAT